MRGLVIFLLILAVMGSFFVAANIGSKKPLNNNVEFKEPAVFEFSTFTSAVCEDKGDFVNCKDEVFVNCNGEISKLIDVAECNGLKLDVPKATGAAVFGKDWEDPRQ